MGGFSEARLREVGAAGGGPEGAAIGALLGGVEGAGKGVVIGTVLAKVCDDWRAYGSYTGRPTPPIRTNPHFPPRLK